MVLRVGNYYKDMDSLILSHVSEGKYGSILRVTSLARIQ